MRIRELAGKWYEYQRSGGTKDENHGLEPLSEEDIVWLKRHDPEAWWTPVIGMGDEHHKRCPSCGEKGVRVGSNFRVPRKKDDKA